MLTLNWLAAGNPPKSRPLLEYSIDVDHVFQIVRRSYIDGIVSDVP